VDNANSRHAMEITGLTIDELFDLLPTPLLLLDSLGSIVRANPAECAMLQYSLGELKGHLLWEFVADEEVPESRLKFQDLLNGHESKSPYRRRFKTKQNYYVTCDLTIRAVHPTAACGAAVLLMSADVTHQLAEQRTKGEVARWMEASYQCSPEATMILNALGQIRRLNRTAEQLLGWKEIEAAGAFVDELMPWRDVRSLEGFPADHGFRTCVSTAWSGTATVTTRGGLLKKLQIKTEPIIDSGGLVLGVISCLRPI